MQKIKQQKNIKTRKQQQIAHSYTGQKKYISLLKKLPLALIEIEKDTIINLTTNAKNLLDIKNTEGEIKLHEIFSDADNLTQLIKAKEKIITVKIGKSSGVLLHIQSFSDNNHIYQFEKTASDTNKFSAEPELMYSAFKSFIEQSNLGICIIHLNGNIIEWNRSMSEMYETEREAYLNKPVWEFDFDYLPSAKKTEKERKRIKDFIIDYLNKPEKSVFEGEFEKEIHGNIKFIQYRIFPIITENGIFFGRINIDISENKASEIELLKYKEHLEDLVGKRTHELHRSEARIRLLLQSIPMAYYSYEPNDRKNIWYSEQIKTLTGFSAEEFKTNPDLWVERVNPDDYAMVGGTFDKLQFNNQRVSCEYRWKDSNDQEIWIFDQAVLIEATEKHSQQIVGCFMDITDRKEAENAIVESERNYREIFNNSTDAICIINPTTSEIEDVNDTLLSMFKTTYKRALTNDFDRFSAGIAPYEQKEALKIIEKVLVNEPEQFEWLARTDTGDLFWIEVNMKLVIINGEAKILAIARNIDEKKKAEEKIKYQHDFEKLILDISSRFINIPFNKVDQGIEKALKDICNFSKTDAGYLFLYDETEQNQSVKYYWNNNSVKFIPEQLVKVPFEFTAWHTGIIKANEVIEVGDISNLPPQAEQLKNIVSGHKVNAFIDVPLIYQNSIIGFLGLSLNQPGRKWLAEEIALLKLSGQIIVNALKRKDSVQIILESEQTHREIYNATSEAIIVHDFRNGAILDVNTAMLNMFGYTYLEALKITLENISSGLDGYTYANALKLITQTIKKGPQVIEWQAKDKNGKLFWIEISMKIAEINGQKCVLSVLRDISERKKAAEILRESEEKYRLLIEGQTDLIIKLDPDNRFLFVSPSYCELFGKTEIELLGNTILPQVHEEDRELTIKALENLFKPPYTCYIEQRAFTKHGWRWIAWSNKAVLDEKKKVIEIIGVGRDITYQKDVEEALRRSEARFRSIVQQLSDSIFILDSNYQIVYDTPSVKSILGYDEGSLVGRSIFDILSPDDKNIFYSKIDSIKNKSDSTLTLESWVKKTTGEFVPAELVFINLLHISSIKGIVLTLRDISERKLLDKKILDAVIKTEEQERERFAKNLHDDLGPLLSSIKMYLGLIKQTDDEKHNYVINQLNEVVKEAITTTKDVSNDLSPHILINYGLVSAIENFIQKVPPSFKVNFKSLLPSQRYSNTIENSLYRIIKELLNNTVKHSEANRIDIILEERGQDLFLQFSDNGKGFNIQSYERGKKTGMGISNIISRAKSLNGMYELFSAPQSGFSFQITIPLHQSVK